MNCLDCQRVFKTKSALTQHLKTHADMHQKSAEMSVVIDSKDQLITDLKRQLQAAHEENTRLIQKVDTLSCQISKIKEILQ
jgi:hypothetical protein